MCTASRTTTTSQKLGRSKDGDPVRVLVQVQGKKCCATHSLASPLPFPHSAASSIFGDRKTAASPFSRLIMPAVITAAVAVAASRGARESFCVSFSQPSGLSGPIFCQKRHHRHCPTVENSCQSFTVPLRHWRG